MSLQDMDAILRLLDDVEALTVYVRGSQDIYLEKKGSFEPAGVRLADSLEVTSLLQALGQQVGRSLSGYEKAVNFRLSDGKRVSAFSLPGADSPLICISR